MQVIDNALPRSTIWLDDVNDWLSYSIARAMVQATGTHSAQERNAMKTIKQQVRFSFR